MIRVLSYPPRHPYVDRLHDEVATLVHRDVVWPRLAEYYDPEWVLRHDRDWDIVHLHFTWEQHPLPRFSAVLDAHRLSHPIVWTAHDLRNPHTGRAEEDAPYLEALASQADAVVTLTPSAAAEVHRRFGRTAVVIPHGPLLDDPVAAALRREDPPAGPPTVLVHAKSLRSNLDLAPAIRVARRVAGAGLSFRLLLSLHDDPAVVGQMDGRSSRSEQGIECWWHPPLEHDALAAAVAEADALLLPYRWGTHSGLIELAADVGTPVIAPDVGSLADQGPGWLVPSGPEGMDEQILEAAFRDVASGRLAPVPTSSDRRAARRGFLVGHQKLYGRLLADRRAP